MSRLSRLPSTLYVSVGKEGTNIWALLASFFYWQGLLTRHEGVEKHAVLTIS